MVPSIKKSLTNIYLMMCGGVGVYTEDGNEMANVISRNVFICHDLAYCRIEWQNNLGVGPAAKEGKNSHLWMGIRPCYVPLRSAFKTPPP